MRVVVFSSLDRHPLDYWPGLEAGTDWPGRSDFSAIELIPDDEDRDRRMSRHEAVLSTIREWAKVLYGNRFSIVLCSDPSPRNRVRTYKGLVKDECRRHAVSFEQHDFVTSGESSVLLNRIELEASAPDLCFEGFWDPFRGFGLLGAVNDGIGRSLLDRLASCGREEWPVWTWDKSLLLRLVCRERLSFFCVQGIWETVKLALYVPKERIRAHVEVVERWAAEEGS